MKMTKLELREQQMRLKTLQKYLPTLQLKKGLLQVEVGLARQAVAQVEDFLRLEQEECRAFAPLLGENLTIDLTHACQVNDLHVGSENIAGLELPVFEKVEFVSLEYPLEDTPIWLDGVILALRRLTRLQVQAKVLQKRLMLLEKELQEVSSRVNLFEKILIPRALLAIRKISVFLGDLQLAAVARAKVAKGKINERKHAFYP